MSTQTRNPRPRIEEEATNWIDKLADTVTGPLLNIFGFGVRLMGPFFVVGFYLLLALHVYAYFTVILTVLKKRLGVEFGIIWVAIGLIIVYNIAYNHFFATIIKPGGPSDLKRIEQVRKELKQREARKQIGHEEKDNDGNVKYVEDDRFEGMSKEVKGLLKYRNKTISQLEQSWKKKCKQCDYIKPIRAHHCSVCNRCVFLMDHHCPWVNNCLGLENLRYFLLFIFYLMIGTVYNLVTIMAIWNHRIYKQNGSMMSFICILDFALTVVLLGFNGWNWYLAMSGFSTIEFFGTVSRQESGEKYDYNFGSIRDNLYKTFGTQSLFAIFSPSLRNVPFSGIEWSYQMRDQGFNEKGEQVQRLFDEEEEEKLDIHPAVNLEEIELSDISQSTSKKRTTNDSTLDFLDKEIEI